MTSDDRSRAVGGHVAPRVRAVALALVCVSSGLAGCGGGGGDGGSEPPPPDALTTAKSAAVETYGRVMSAGYADATATASALHDAIHDFLDAPSQAGLDAARAAWNAARPFYQATEIGRFYNGPIDREPGGPEGQINAWPLDEVYIDYVDGAADAGIVNDEANFPVIDEEVLAAANERGGEANISTGWHAIEFLLWGQDFDPAAPGNRPFTDYVTDGTGTAANQDRRGEYLEVAADLLVADLGSVRDEWATGGAYRTEFASLTSDAALSRMMTGVGSLAFGELRGERILVPFTTKLPEDEHSCFSDTTARDHHDDVLGMQNVWLGRWESSDGSRDVTGTGLRDVVLIAAPELAAEIDDTLDELLTLLSSSTIVPFDQAIQGTDDAAGRQTLQQVIDGLAQFNEQWSELASVLGVEIDTGSSE